MITTNYKNNLLNNNFNSFDNIKSLYIILLCFFFLNLFIPEIFSSTCYCRGIPEADNFNLNEIEEIPLPIIPDPPFIESVLTITNIARVFITSTFTNILYPIFINFPDYFSEALFPLEYANELMGFEPHRSNQYIFEHTQAFIREQVEDMNDEQRAFMLNNIIVNPEQCQSIIQDYREVFDRSFTIRSSSFSSSSSLSPVSSPRN